LKCSCNGRLIDAIRQDTDRYVFSLYGDARVTLKMRLRASILFPGLSAVMLYRVYHHLLHGVRSNTFTRLAYSAVWLPARMHAVIVGIEIDANAHIGSGLFINHFGAIIIGPANIGENCNISQSVTIGRSSKVSQWEHEDAEPLDIPTIGNRVWIGPGAVIAGLLTVADDASVSANSLVTRDIPAGGIAMGVPAQVVSTKGSFRQVRYRGMEVDEGRAAALLATR
jgi:serine O-acetyltransferase